MIERMLYTKTWQDLAESKHMIFLAGPRQSGKTTLARMIARTYSNTMYWSWDIPQDRISFLENHLFFEGLTRKDASFPLVIFDEIHKYRDWKNYLKGIYDQFHDQYAFLVTGSGRLDLYQKGGDSLAGRYFLFHLFPFTISELGNNNRTIEEFLKDPLSITMNRFGELREIWTDLSRFSGFPEPYVSGKETIYRRWSNTYSQQLIREDIRDMTDIKSIKDMETLYLLLPSRVGSPLSVPSLVRDIKASYNTIQNWLSILERFLLVLSITPWTSKISRTILKERKTYLLDAPRIKDAAAQFENMVAIELLRAITAWNDIGYGTFSIHFIKNKEGQEVDFLIANENNPLLLIEAKITEENPSPVLKKFQSMLDIPAVQLTRDGDGYRIFSNGTQRILVAPACQWLSQLP